MARSAPRLTQEIHALIDRCDDPALPIAEVVRRVGAAASSLGLPRPSYERVRLLVHERRRRGRYPGMGEVVLDVLMRTRPPDAIFEQQAGLLPPKRP